MTNMSRITNTSMAIAAGHVRVLRVGRSYSPTFLACFSVMLPSYSCEWVSWLVSSAVPAYVNIRFGRLKLTPSRSLRALRRRSCFCWQPSDRRKHLHLSDAQALDGQVYRAKRVPSSARRQPYAEPPRRRDRRGKCILFVCGKPCRIARARRAGKS